MVAIALLLLAGVTVSTWQAVRATKAEGPGQDNVSTMPWSGKPTPSGQSGLWASAGNSLTGSSKRWRFHRKQGYGWLAHGVRSVPWGCPELETNATGRSASVISGCRPEFGRIVGGFRNGNGSTGLTRDGHRQGRRPSRAKGEMVELAFAPDGQSLFGRGYEPGDPRAGTAARISLIEWRRSRGRIMVAAVGTIHARPSPARGDDSRRIIVLEDSAGARSDWSTRNRAAGRRGSAGLRPDFPAAFALSSDHRLAACLGESGTNQPASVSRFGTCKPGSSARG